jgi:hypothetical protein
MSNLVIINIAIYYFVYSFSVISVGKIVALLQPLVCALGLGGMHICHIVYWLHMFFLSPNSSTVSHMGFQVTVSGFALVGY